MKHLTYSLLGTMLMVFVLTACGAPSGGPQAWLDWPLDNTTIPLAPLTIQAHASDEDGIAHFEFYVNDTPLFTINSDGKRLGEAVVEWTPPGPGVYTIQVHAIDSGGNVGSEATVIVTVNGELLATQLPPLTLAETATTFAEPVDDIVTETLVQGNNSGIPTIKANLDANCRSGPGTAYAVIGSLLNGQVATITGRNADSSWWVLDPGVSGRSCWISGTVVEVTGDITGVAIIAAPPLPITDTPTPTLVPTVTPSPTVPSQADTTPPGFFSTDIYPDEILTQSNGCPSYERTTTVAAAVGDESGISSIIAYWNIGGAESGQVNLAEGGLGYWATIGPVSTVGTMEVFMIAQDTAGNTSQSGTLYVTVNNCIE